MSGKIGEGHAAAMGRAGLKELSQALVALPESSIRPVEEPGLAGNPTSYEVTGVRHPAVEVGGGGRVRLPAHGV